MLKKTLLWVLAVLLAGAAMIYQRSTGPTYPYKGALEHSGEAFKYKLIRTHETTHGATITMPYIESGNYSASINYKRYQTQDDVTKVDFKLNENNEFVAQLPVQPAAGKMEYYISGQIDGRSKFSISLKKGRKGSS